MTTGKRRLIVCSDPVWLQFLSWGRAHNVQGYHGRLTVQAIISALLEAAQKEQAS